MGYAGFNNLDKRFLDVRGLMSPRIARLHSPYRTYVGIQDPAWYRPNDPLYPVIVSFRPDIIVAPAAGPETVLNRYRVGGRMCHVSFYVPLK
jgi:hypothetical protein